MYFDEAWYTVWYGFWAAFGFDLATPWHYERLPEDQWVIVRAPWFYLVTPSNWNSTYPTDTEGYSERDLENWFRAMAAFEAIRPLALPYVQNGQDVIYDLWVQRPAGLESRVVFRIDLFIDYFTEKTIIGQVITLPFWYEGLGAVGQKSHWPWHAWQVEGGMDEQSRQAILEIRDGLRPWTYGNSLVPVPNNGQPGFLELHRQMTNEETLGVYYQPTLRDLVKEASSLCVKELVGRRVWVKIDVSGNRAGANDSQLPHGDAPWVHNHYGQVRLRWQYPSEGRERFSEWRWIRARESVEVFNLPWVQGQVPVVTPQVRRYGGLTVTAQVISGATVSCDSVGGSDDA